VKTETLSFYESAVRAAAEQVERSLDEALDLERLARRACLSPFHFHRIFRGMLGETPLELHRRLRLERAAHQLRSQATPVTTIALTAGYDSHEAFTRAFRARYGRSPSEFRSDGRSPQSGCARPPQIEIASRSGIHFEPNAESPRTLRLIQGNAPMNVEIKPIPSLRAATVHHQGPYHRISEAFARLGALAGQAGLIQGKATLIAIYHDDPETTLEPDLRSDAGVVIAEAAAIPPGLGELCLPAGNYACTRHLGAYEGLGDTWSRFLGQWLPQSGQRMGSGTAFEIYVNTPLEVATRELITELYIPLA
jgi:AraC family transcriptional regulator